MSFDFSKAGLLGVVLAALLLSACGRDGDRIRVEEDMTSAIGVNGYLWRASLDSLAALPLETTDSSGGIIMTDWFVDAQVPNERTKVTVYITDQRLRADALDVRVARQTLADGVWVTAEVMEGTEKKIEETILNRARALWIQNLDE